MENSVKEEKEQVPAGSAAAENGDAPAHKQKLKDNYFKGAECLILDEYIVEDPRPVAKAADISTDTGKKEEGNEGNNKKGNKKRGQNKNRPIFKEDYKDRLCPSLVDVDVSVEAAPQCDYRGNCKFQHDAPTYLANKQPDIGPECYNYKTLGHCVRGLQCRWADSHIDRQTGRNLKNPHLIPDSPSELNVPGRDMLISLRKKQYDFKLADNACNIAFQLAKERDAKKQELRNGGEVKKEEEDEKENKFSVEEGGMQEEAEGLDEREGEEPARKKVKVEEEEETVKRVSHVTDEDLIKLRPQEKKKLDWSDKTYLAPLTTVGNLPFRRVCKGLGVDITCSEMALALPLLKGHSPEWALLKRHHTEDFFGVQVAGCSPPQMIRVAQLLDQEVDCDFVDINMGCPIDLIYKQGMGSGLMVRKRPLEIITRTMAALLTRPLTVKMRTGVFTGKNIAHTLFPAMQEMGVGALTIHGRSREQRYTRLADWEYIGECRARVDTLPVFGNGDILNYEDYYAKKESSGVTGIMLARGALIKPWIFTEIKERRHWDITAQERLDIVKDFVNYGLEHWGSDDRGVENTRRFLLEWLSFTYRYVPYGILKAPPQRINERLPGAYRGRNELETLLASPNSQDWVKITEMFLGKVKDGFEFLPKHKANSYS